MFFPYLNISVCNCVFSNHNHNHNHNHNRENYVTRRDFSPRIAGSGVQSRWALQLLVASVEVFKRDKRYCVSLV